MFNGFITALKNRLINPGQPKIDSAHAVTDVLIGSEGIGPSELNGMHETHSPAVGLELTNQLANCARELISSCKSVESSFLSLGQDLQSIHSDATDLNQRTINAIQACGGDTEDKTLHKVVALAKETLAELRSNCSQLTDNIGQSDKIIGHLNTLFKLGKSIKRTSKSLKMIGLNLNIESARLDEENEVFVNLAHEIKRLPESISELSAAMIEDAQTAQSKLTTARIDFGRNIDQLEITAQSTEKTLNDAVSAVEKILELSLDIFSRAGEHAQEITRRVGDIVVGIQIHDSISQRVEHIAASLDEAKSLHVAATETDDIREKMATAHSIVRLQAAQLGTIITETGEVYRQSLEAFHTIEKIIEEMTVNLSKMDSDDRKFSELTADNDHSPIRSLKSALEHITGLIEEATDRIARLNMATEDSMESVNRLAGHMDRILSINSEIHMGALNAIVNSTRLGAKGAAIAVLVQNMSDTATQSSEFATAVGEEIEAISDTTKTMRNPHRDSHNDDSAKRLKAGLDEFTESCGVFRKESNILFEQGAILRENISTIKQNLQFYDRFSSGLNQQLKQLKAIEDALSPWAGDTTDTATVKENRLHDRYTMETERNVHHAFFGQLAKPVDVSNPGLDTHADCDIELFEDTGESAPAVKERKAVDNELGDNIELF